MVSFVTSLPNPPAPDAEPQPELRTEQRIAWLTLVIGLAAGAASALTGHWPWASGLMIVGSIVINLPPQPIGFAPLVAIAVGAVLFGVALGGWGFAIWSGASAVPRVAPAKARPSPA